jgi:hypothetical protein
LSNFRKHKIEGGDFKLYCIKHYNDILNPNIKTNVVFEESLTKVEKKSNIETEDDKIYKEVKVDLKKKEELKQKTLYTPEKKDKNEKVTISKPKYQKCPTCNESVLLMDKLE